VLRLSGERATKKQAHWQSVALAACEQCGGNRVPVIHPVCELAAWLKGQPGQEPSPTIRCVLSLASGTQPLSATVAQHAGSDPLLLLSGPEGGLSVNEDAQARSAGFAPVTLGLRILRAETAALAALALLVLQSAR
jgi:16S rRNA (uracil1498-N3)-methyltransferase